MNPLHEKLLSMYHFDTERLNYMLSFFHESIFPKRSFLLQEGELSDRIFFIESGLVREFSIFINAENLEDFATTGIVSEGKFVYSAESYLNGERARSFIQALENTRVFFIRKTDVSYLSETLRGASAAFSRIHESYVLEYEKKVQLLRLPNAGTAYDHFFKLNPELKNRVPDKYIASYLNIHPKSLSRLKNEKR